MSEKWGAARVIKLSAPEHFHQSVHPQHQLTCMATAFLNHSRISRNARRLHNKKKFHQSAFLSLAARRTSATGADITGRAAHGYKSPTANFVVSDRHSRGPCSVSHLMHTRRKIHKHLAAHVARSCIIWKLSALRICIRSEKIKWTICAIDSSRRASPSGW
jgi:hypothetical protein